MENQKPGMESGCVAEMMPGLRPWFWEGALTPGASQVAGVCLLFMVVHWTTPAFILQWLQGALVTPEAPSTWLEGWALSWVAHPMSGAGDEVQ